MQVLRRCICISYLYEGAKRAVCRVVCDQEPHVFVAQFHWSRTIHGGQGGLLTYSNYFCYLHQQYFDRKILESF